MAIAMAALVLSTAGGFAAGTGSGWQAGAAQAPTPKPAAAYTLHAPIVILNDSDFVIGQKGVTGGTGAWNDPFVIEGWEIGGTSIECIYMENIGVFFKIQNCWIHNPPTSFTAVHFWNVSTMIFQNNRVWNCPHGLGLGGSEGNWNILITHNNFTNINGDGINLYKTNHTIINGNMFFNNSNCVYTSDSYYNLICYNYFNYSVPTYCWDLTGKNIWNQTDKGNYWWDHTGPDDNHDGIVDTAYSIGGGSAQDFKPIAASPAVPQAFSPAGIILVVAVLAGIAIAVRYNKRK